MKRLLELGLVADAPGDPGDNPRRRYHRLMDAGRRALTAETRRMADVVGVARAKWVMP